ncbi:hypothetical protein MYCTH_2088766 [Thermothelomyces thermophilus ATCC 42464]|uniref:BHLH domain-containing protein n=1 Tax=Thermothelomyces thermophilus (strain ATCC 42464 / BCRC 31852 / DSM 1799) TaxID=573729 RepID=G2Q2E6_THET4|nr:uncharacterized protein MYCTH_2088766 [Thermothelomyces thermophilus ATCC 42464]AEO54271.1 hypothetical protein MYCTH_2088766 [Thermothelomyces thermophilus ATCC 42464]
MAQHGFSMNGHGGIDPNDLAMTGNYQAPFQHNFNHNNPSNFSSGSAGFGDDELLEGLNSPIEAPSGVQDFGNMNDMGVSYSHGVYGSHPGLPINQQSLNGYSSTPDGDPIQSPFAHNFAYRQMGHAQSFGALKSPLSYAGSPLANAELNDNNDPNFLSAQAQARNRLANAMQRKPSSTARGSLTPKSAAMTGMTVNSESTFGAQPIRTTGAHHEKSHSGQWIQTPNSLSSFPGSGFSSPLQQGLPGNQINDLILKGGVSMPAKLGASSAAAASTQEARRKRRRESHNLVERRRRDNINERIQDLSKLVPLHRLEDEKIRKAIQNGTPLSPTLSGIGGSSQATSGLAGPGARRAAGGSAGNITTGLPVEDKDKGPNKGDILNGAVSWTRDLMWMLNLKIQQQEELINALYERGGQLPFEITDDERRMQTELLEAMARIDETTGQAKSLSYSRTAGSGLRVPHHTDYRGEPLNNNNSNNSNNSSGTSNNNNNGAGGSRSGSSSNSNSNSNNNNNGVDHDSISPGENGNGMTHDMLDSGDFVDFEDDGSGDVFREEDEFGMDLTA